ncbi:MAG: glycosyltransferase family 1 protein [Lachnospiraceae bacterium]|nr:glycosyltransferase family 1 protein [Lachnospiraceae bacterium]
MGMGGFLLSNYQPELDEFFVDGEDLVLYTSTHDLINKVEYYLSHEEERTAIALNGQQKVFSLFSIEHQLLEMFRLFKE